MIPAPSNPAHVLTMLGVTLDRGVGPRRWSRWRPTVDLCRHEDLEVGHLDVLYAPGHEELLEQVVRDITAVSPGTTVQAHPLALDNPWDFEEVYEGMLELVEGLTLERASEGPLVHITTGTHVMQICWFLLTESRQVPGRLLQTSPSRGDDLGPGSWDIIDLDLSRYDRLARRFERERAEDLSFLKDGIETASASFNTLIERIEAVAIASREPILLTGPTGAGKTRLARRIHALKRHRRQVSGELVEVDCATLRGDQAMSTLFGHVRGAFTGAVGAREGLLLRAHGGMLFLDEIGDLGLDEQAMLLRAVEDHRFLPVGADVPVDSDFQLIAGTHVDLSAAVAQGRFRDDLLARIDLWAFDLPGLRARSDDIAPNLEHELARMSTERGRPVRMNREARQRFLERAAAPDAAWTGNFRDLRAAVIRMATLAPAGCIDEATVDEEFERLHRRWGGSGSGTPVLDLTPLVGGAALDRFDAVQLADVVTVCRTSPSLASAGRRLFAESFRQRNTRNDGDRLRKYLARFELDWAGVGGGSQLP